MRTVKNVAICLDESEMGYIVQIDRDDIEPFFIEFQDVVEITDELVEGCSWAAEIELVDGLVPYLKAYGIFGVDVTENGFTVNCNELRGKEAGQ